MWVMSHVNNVASARAKINLHISLFSTDFSGSEQPLQEWEAKLLYSVLVIVP